jgi:hypothetical protein
LGLKETLLSERWGSVFDTIDIQRFKFYSQSHNILPGVRDYHCKYHNIDFLDHDSYYNDIGTIRQNVHIRDIFVEENKAFDYYILKPGNVKKAKKVTFLFHGFNEKNWDKYLPWAKAICDNTQSAVVLFPIAFHMQRAPLYWSDKRNMFELSERRKSKYPNIVDSSLSNVAISMRLHSMPQRFIWSGLQTYYDVIQLIEECKGGAHELIDKDFSFNIFAYSIGALLAEILKFSNPKNYFDETKLCLFCGGPVFNRLSPVSKYILDSEANVALYSFLIEHFDSYLRKDRLLRHYIDEDHFEGKVFRAMLDYQKSRDFREELFRKSEDQIYAISLKKDDVIPTFEVMNTLQGAYRNIGIRVDEFDFDYKYTHENPFPSGSEDREKVDRNFLQVFDRFCEFLNR